MLVLNATYEPINVCTVRRAVVLLLKEKAEVLEHAEWELHSATRSISRPMVIRLVSYVRIPRDTHRRKITRRAVFARDNWTCQYCGAHSNLTVDHVIPRSKGGVSSWDNIVASCAPCNRRKGNALPRQAGMQLLTQPRTPAWRGSALPLRRLHGAHEATMFSQFDEPPLDRGTTWSTVRLERAPQYWHVQSSRANTARRVILRRCVSRGMRTYVTSRITIGRAIVEVAE